MIIRLYSACEKRKRTSPDLFLKDFRNNTFESKMASVWTEEKCRYMDHLELEDKSHTATRRERQRNENNWKLTINAQGPVSPMDKRDDCSGGCESHQEFVTTS